MKSPGKFTRIALVALILTGLLISAGQTKTPAAQAQGCPWGWTVRSGETLSYIAGMFGVTEAAIKNANPQVRIRPGVFITIPCPTVVVPKKLLDKDGKPADVCWNGRTFYRCKKVK